MALVASAYRDTRRAITNGHAAFSSIKSTSCILIGNRASRVASLRWLARVDKAVLKCTHDQ